MARAYSSDLRVRIIEAIKCYRREGGGSFFRWHGPAGAWHRDWRKTGQIEPDWLRNTGGSKLDAHEDFIILGLIACAERHHASRGAKRPDEESADFTCSRPRLHIS
jgi:hypothetical protein